MKELNVKLTKRELHLIYRGLKLQGLKRSDRILTKILIQIQHI